MSEFKAGEAVRVSDCEVKTLMSVRSDSHSAIRAEHGIREDRGPMDRAHTPVELLPVYGIDPGKPGMWRFQFHDRRPDWWTDGMTDQAIRQMLAFVAEHHFGARGFHHPGDVRMSRLEIWLGGTPFRSGGDAVLPRLTRWGMGSPFECGGDAELPNLTTWGTRSPFWCRGNADLSSLTSWPEDAPFGYGGVAHLPNLSTWGANSPFERRGQMWDGRS